MPYSAPTLSQFRTKFPLFAAVTDNTVTAAVAEASEHVDLTWREADYQPAILYLAAHLLTVDGALLAAAMPGEAGQIVATGEVSEMKVGDVMVRRGSESGGASSGVAIAATTGFGASRYGQRYLQLLRANNPPVLVV